MGADRQCAPLLGLRRSNLAVLSALPESSGESACVLAWPRDYRSAIGGILANVVILRIVQPRPLGFLLDTSCVNSQGMNKKGRRGSHADQTIHADR
ncbi:MAG: hypothetical protein N2C14_25865 [Planctomycetales bacterium]